MGQHRCRTFPSLQKVLSDNAVLQEFQKSFLLVKATVQGPPTHLSSKDLQDKQHSFGDLHNEISKWTDYTSVSHGSEPCIQVETSGQHETDNRIIQFRITGVGQHLR